MLRMGPEVHSIAKRPSPPMQILNQSVRYDAVCLDIDDLSSTNSYVLSEERLSSEFYFVLDRKRILHEEMEQNSDELLYDSSRYTPTPRGGRVSSEFLKITSHPVLKATMNDQTRQNNSPSEVKHLL